jgi:hypothetical protein
MQYYSVIKKNEVMSFAGKWTGIITLSKISQAQRAKYHIFAQSAESRPKEMDDTSVKWGKGLFGCGK